MVKITAVMPLLRRFGRAKASSPAAFSAPSGPSPTFSSPPLWIQPSRALLPPLPAVAHLLDIPRDGASLQEAVARFLSMEGTVQADLLKQLEEAELQHFVRTDTYPLPATEDREGYYGDQHLRYWLSGLGDYVYIKYLLREHNVPIRPKFSLLDLGCASGRVLRHFTIQETGWCVYGADINHNSIKWIRQYLPRSILCFQNSILPHLSLGDNSLDLICGCSVFTHIDNFEEAWLLELRRVLKPGGLAFITIHSERTWNQINEDHFMYKYFSSTPHVVEDFTIGQITLDLFQRDMPADRVVFTHTGYAINNTNVFHASTYIREKWGQLFKVIDIVPKAHGGHQDGVLLLKE